MCFHQFLKIRNWKQSFVCFQFPSQIEFWEQFLFSVYFRLQNKFFSSKNKNYFWKQKIKRKNSYQTYHKCSRQSNRTIIFNINSFTLNFTFTSSNTIGEFEMSLGFFFSSLKHLFRPISYRFKACFSPYQTVLAQIEPYRAKLVNGKKNK